MRTVGIVGSRNWNDFDAFCEAMPSLVGYERVVSGGQKGVDTMAELLAKALGLQFQAFPPDQARGESFTDAAHERNQRIVDESDYLIAFPGPKSMGTYDALRRAKRKGIRTAELRAPR